jgi:energy-converting hydrogenase A subunit M
MTQETLENPDNTLNPDNKDPKSKPTIDANDPAVQELLQKLTDEKLTDIKKKLDSAFAARDDALRKIAEREEKDKADLKKNLEEQGKFKELYELQLAEEKAKREALEKRNTELTRDVELRAALSNFQFRSEAAADMAFKTISEKLVKDDKGNWVHPTGAQIKDFVQSFAQDESYSFLFKAATNSGGGLSPNNPGGKPPEQGKSLFQMSQAEVLKLAAEGKFGPVGPTF